MSINAETALDGMDLGSSIIYQGKEIAKIANKQQDFFEIEDIHGKHWVLHRDKISSTILPILLEELSKIIDHNWQKQINQKSAIEVLSEMPVNTNLYFNNEWIATLIDKDDGDQALQNLTFEGKNGSELPVNLDQISPDTSFDDFKRTIKDITEDFGQPDEETILTRYFKEEFIPIMIEQMKYDHQRLGDTWLMKPSQGIDRQIRKRYEEYFEMNEKDGKPVPWLKIAGYAIIAQARLDHPEWLL